MKKKTKHYKIRIKNPLPVIDFNTTNLLKIDFSVFQYKTVTEKELEKIKKEYKQHKNGYFYK